MSCPDSASASDALAAALTGPRSASTDGVSVEQHSLPDLIAAHKYLAGLCAARSRTRGLRFNTLVPDGTVRARPSPAGAGSVWGYGFDRWRDV